MTLDLLTTGYPSIDYIYNVSRSPQEDETAILESFSSKGSYGGCGLNVAVALATLGFAVGTSGVFGGDPDGLAYIDQLRSMNIETDNVICLSDCNTSRTYIFLNPAGRYQLFFYPGAAGEWRPPLELKGLSNTRACLVTVGPSQYNQVFVDKMMEAGLPLFWQLKADVQAYPAAQLGRLKQASKLLFMNEAECSYLLGTLGATNLQDVLEEDQIAVLTAGSHGSEVYTKAGSVAVPAVPPRQFVDSTGAGDGFTAGYLAGHFRGFAPEICARLGAVLASFVIEAVGCQTSLPNWSQLTERYQSFFQESFE
jgi:adenosine kinase